jgi:hypothetical protein
MQKLKPTELQKRLLPFGPECFVFHLPSKNIKIKIHRTIILPVVLLECKTWSLTLAEGVQEQGAEEDIWAYDG